MSRVFFFLVFEYNNYTTGEDSDVPVITNSSGFVDVPQNNMINIGQSTCLSLSEGGPLMIFCPLTSGRPDFYDFTYTWSKDGQIIENESNVSILIDGRGLYSCSVSSECGTDIQTSQIYGKNYSN